MPDFKVKTKFTFTGYFYVKAEDRAMARKMVEQNCGLVMGGHIHTNLDENDIDWNFDTHPEKDVIIVTKA